MGRKVIISCAITGLDPYPVDVAASAGDAGRDRRLRHRRRRGRRGDPASPRPRPVDRRADAGRRGLRAIRADASAPATDAIVNITTGGSARMTIEERLSGPASLRPEMCSLNLGTMNFGLYPMLDRPREWKHDWEVPFLEATRGGMFKNTLADIETILTTMSAARHPLRVRMLRCRPPLHPGPFPRPQARHAAALRPDGARHPRRHRRQSRQRHGHAPHRRQAVRARL